MGRSQRVLIQMDYFFCSATYLEKNEKTLTSKKCVIFCALPETEDCINSFQVGFHSLSSENLWKPLDFYIFRWLEREPWPEMSKP